MIGLEKTKSVVRIFKSVSDGAHANTRGFHGSLTAYNLQKIFNEVDPYRTNFLDIGFGTGVVLAAALTSGAAKPTASNFWKTKPTNIFFKLQ